ncbi:MAG TPA: xanthine dehydrogenase family protein molybdopterin-binding subunit [Micropepsaceae bacterium]|nr:xanthine dehydrogenase family protein molybdopterin-binding subunit [Micropepsaceae bacterium]
MKFGIGQPVRRREDIRFVTGTGHYLDDLKLLSQVHAAFVRSPHAHARILSVDASAAESAPGVLGVLTAKDVEGAGSIPVRSLVKNRDGSDIKQSPKALLPGDKVRFTGEAVAMVVAETVAQAKDAAELVLVEYEPMAAAASLEQVDAPPVWDDAPGNLCFDWEAGDDAATAAAFAAATKVVSVELVQNRIVPNPMETRGAIGVYDQTADRYTLYTSTQGGSMIRGPIAGAVLKIPSDKLRVVTPDVGGGFGLKASAVVEQSLVLVAAKKFGHPVKWISERMEAFLADGHSRDVKMKGELALDRDARILGLRLSSRANLGAYMTHVGPLIPTAGLRVMGGVYRVPATYANVRGYFTNTTTVTSYRGAGRPEAIYVTERLMDIAAAAFGIDRLEIRRRNLIEKHELPRKNWRGLTVDSGDFIGVLEETAKRADWAGFEARRKQSRARGLLRGIGVSYYMEASGGPPVVEPSQIHFKDDGTVEVFVATQSNGQGHETVFAQLVAERLGVPYETVIIKQGDTDHGVAGGGTVGSRSVQTAGSAIALAADAVITKGKLAAGQVLQAGGEPVEFAVEDGVGVFRVKNSKRAISMVELARTLKRERLPGFEGGLDDKAAFDSPPTFPNGCHICEVEVDPETGQVKLARYTIADDVGRVINPLIVDGQIHGGVAQGIGQAMLENVVYAEDSGQLATATFVDYVMPRAEDMPKLDISYAEIPCLTNPLGVKGAGEAGTIGSLPAIVGAISHALGVAHIDMPATSEKVWRLARTIKQ